MRTAVAELVICGRATDCRTQFGLGSFAAAAAATAVSVGSPTVRTETVAHDGGLTVSCFTAPDDWFAPAEPHDASASSKALPTNPRRGLALRTVSCRAFVLAMPLNTRGHATFTARASSEDQFDNSLRRAFRSPLASWKLGIVAYCAFT